MAYTVEIGHSKQGNVLADEGALHVLPYFWNADTLSYEVATVNATTGTGQEVVVTNVVPVSQSGSWTVGQGTPGSSNSPWWTQSVSGTGAGSTEVDVKSITPSTAHIGDVSISSGSVTVSSGAVLGPSTAAIGQISSGTQTIGTVIPASGTQTIGTVLLGSAGTTGSIGSVALLAGSTANSVGAVALLSGSSANMLGQVVQGPPSSANAWFVQSVPFSSGGVARTTVNTSADASLIAANANRKALVIASLSTAQVCALGLTTATMTTALANVSFYLQPSQQMTFGLPGGMPLYQGPVRGINITSTAVAGGVSVTEFT